jgi:hypothetical protein
MDMIDLYVAEVGKQLPWRGRHDIEAELRSTLQDMLDDRSKRANRPVDDDMIKALLTEYGPPNRVAATYQPARYIIGPRLYPFFIFVLKIVLTVLTVVMAVTLGIQLGSQSLRGTPLVQGMATGLAGILGADLQAFGNMVLVFAILERVMPAREFKFDEETKEWDPASLTKTEAKNDVKPWDPITSILFTAAALILFNGYPQLIGINFVRDGQWTSIPVLTEAFWRWMPYVNILWALQIALQLVLLRHGRWQPATRWIRTALNAAGTVIAYVLLTGPAVVELSSAALQATGAFDAATAATLSQLLPQLGRAIIAIVMVVQGVDVIRDVLRPILKRI